MIAMPKVWKFDHDVNTDVIIPARYNITTVPEELAKKVFCEVRPAFAQEVSAGDVIVAGENFGCGSSREHAPIAIKAAGIRCVIAISYARIFRRNAINIGLSVLECKQAYEEINEGDEATVNPQEGTITIHASGKRYQAAPLPAFILKIVAAGGIVNFLKNNNIEDLQ